VLLVNICSCSKFKLVFPRSVAACDWISLSAICLYLALRALLSYGSAMDLCINTSVYTEVHGSANKARRLITDRFHGAKPDHGWKRLGYVDGLVWISMAHIYEDADTTSLLLRTQEVAKGHRAAQQSSDTMQQWWWWWWCLWDVKCWMACMANDGALLVRSGIYCTRIGTSLHGMSTFQIDHANCSQGGEDDANFHGKWNKRKERKKEERL